MAEQHEFIAKDRAAPQSAQRDSHTATRITVQKCLRTVDFMTIDQRALWCGWQSQLLRKWGIVFPGRDDFLRVHFFLQCDAGAFQVALARRHAVTLRADNYGRIAETRTLCPASKHLASLALYLFFFSTNIRYGIIEYIVGRQARIARA